MVTRGHMDYDHLRPVRVMAFRYYRGLRFHHVHATMMVTLCLHYEYRCYDVDYADLLPIRIFGQACCKRDAPLLMLPHWIHQHLLQLGALRGTTPRQASLLYLG